MKRTRKVNLLLRRQHGVAHTDQLSAHRRAVRRSVDARVFEHVFPHVVRLCGSAETEMQHLWSAVLDAGPSAHISHTSAARFWGFGEKPDRPHVTSRRTWVHDRREYVLHRSLFADGICRRHGLAVSSPLRTLAELGATEPAFRVERCLDYFVSMRLVSVNAVMQWRIDHAGRGRRGVGVLGEVLESRLVKGEVSDSQLEAAFARLLQGARIGEFEFHRRIRVGRSVFEVDFAFDRARIVVEVDGFEFHGSRHAFEEDRRRDAALASAGWLVLRFTWRDVVDRPDIVIGHLRRAIEART